MNYKAKSRICKDELYRYTINKELYVKSGVRRVFRIVIDKTSNTTFRIVSGYIRKIKKEIIMPRVLA